MSCYCYSFISPNADSSCGIKKNLKKNKFWQKGIKRRDISKSDQRKSFSSQINLPQNFKMTRLVSESCFTTASILTTQFWNFKSLKVELITAKC